MVGTPEATDWLNKANPDQLVQYGKAVISKIAAMDPNTQDRFVQELRSDPTASRLFERLGTHA